MLTLVPATIRVFEVPVPEERSRTARAMLRLWRISWTPQGARVRRYAVLDRLRCINDPHSTEMPSPHSPLPSTCTPALRHFHVPLLKPVLRPTSTHPGPSDL
jgi:hypothetical protein